MMICKVEIGKWSKPDLNNHSGICLHEVEKKNRKANPDWSRASKPGPLDFEDNL
jgi:hypothetical protein